MEVEKVLILEVVNLWYAYQVLRMMFKIENYLIIL